MSLWPTNHIGWRCRRVDQEIGCVQTRVGQSQFSPVAFGRWSNDMTPASHANGYISGHNFDCATVPYLDHIYCLESRNWPDAERGTVNANDANCDFDMEEGSYFLTCSYACPRSLHSVSGL